MLQRFPGVKITGSREGAARRPPIYAILDDQHIELRREGKHNLDPLEARFTLAEAQDLHAALAELLKEAAARRPPAPLEKEGAEGEAAADQDSTFG